jgi:hypothetical protein
MTSEHDGRRLRMMNNRKKELSIKLVSLGILLIAFMHPAKAQVVLSVGYLNNLNGLPAPEAIPSPFDPDAATILISNGGTTSTHDTGVIRLENQNEFPVTIDRGLRVTTDARDAQSRAPLFQIWDDFLPIVLSPGQSLIFAETANFNFDTSDVAEFTIDNPPVISGSVSAARFSFTDRGFILLGNGDASSPAETTPYQRLGEIRPPGLLGGTIQGLGALQAECRDVNSGQIVGGPITEGTLNCIQLGLQSQPGDRIVVRVRGLSRSGGPLPPQPVGASTDVRCSNGQVITITTGTGGGKCEPANPTGRTTCTDGENTATADCITHNCGGTGGKGDCKLK